MSRIRVAAAALLMTISSGAFAAGPLPILQPGGLLGGLGLGGILGGVSLGGLGGLGTVPLLNVVLPGGIPALPPLVPRLVGTLTKSLDPIAGQLPLVGLVSLADPLLRPIITPLSDVVYIPVLGAAFGHN